MVALKMQNFGGMLPAVDRHLLPQTSAEIAENAFLYTGAVQGFKALKPVFTPTDPGTQKVFRVPIQNRDSGRIPNSYWLEFPSPNTDVVRSPTTGDQFERFYWASDIGRPMYNSRARIAANDPPLVLGVPRPPAAPTVIVSGGAAPIESRAYVYTWVTDFGEESAPSPPVVLTGNASGTWAVTVTAPNTGALTDRLLDKVRIYRTVSGVGGETDYFFVGEMPIADTVFDDAVASVTNNRLLESLFWTEPPLDLRGFVVMPNGIIAAWRANEIWFCEPFQPHAWPVTYQISVDATIVGCGVIGQTLVVCTEGAPYAVTGANPASMSQSRLATFEPCTSRGSIVSTPVGVTYSSPNGLVLATAAGAVPITRQMMLKEDWSEILYLPSLFAATFNGGYYTMGSTAIGCFAAEGFNTDAFLPIDFSGAFTGMFVEPTDMRIAVTKLRQPVPVRNVYNDLWTGEVFVLRDDGLFWLDQTRACEEPRQPYIWRSKVLETPEAENFEAMKVHFSTHNCSPDLNPVRYVELDQELQPDQYGIVRVFADGRLCMARELRKTGEFWRLPSGFKAAFWQIEVESRVKLESIEIATSAKELTDV